MSCSFYMYDPRFCEGRPCIGDCDGCGVAREIEEALTIESLFEEDWFHGNKEQMDKIRSIAEDPSFTEEDVALAVWMVSSAEFSDIAYTVKEIVW